MTLNTTIPASTLLLHLGVDPAKTVINLETKICKTWWWQRVYLCFTNANRQPPKIWTVVGQIESHKVYLTLLCMCQQRKLTVVGINYAKTEVHFNLQHNLLPSKGGAALAPKAPPPPFPDHQDVRVYMPTWTSMNRYRKPSFNSTDHTLPAWPHSL